MGTFAWEFQPEANAQAIVQGENFRFTVLTESLLRLEYSEDGVFEDRATQSIWNRRFPVPKFTVNRSEKMLEIVTDHFHLYYTYGPFTKYSLWIDVKNNYSLYANRWYFGEKIETLKGTVRTLGKILDVFVYALSATPRVAFIPLIIVFLGLGASAKSFIVFLGAVMPILINAYAGALNADDELVEMARSVGARKSRIFREIVLPGALPFAITGLRIGATIGLINTIVAELYTAVRGLGGLLAIYGNTFRMAEYFVIVFTLALVGVLVTTLLRLLELRLERWRGTGNQAS